MYLANVQPVSPFYEISRDLNLNVVQIGSVWGIMSFGSIFISPIGGILADRLGSKRTIVMLGLLSGIAGIRGVSNGFLSLMATTFLWGVFSSAIIPALNMVASQNSSSQRQGWHKVDRGRRRAGTYCGFSIGASLLSPWLGGWRYVFFLYGGIAIAISLFWQFSVKEPEHFKPAGSKVLFRCARHSPIFYTLKLSGLSAYLCWHIRVV